MRSDLSSGLVVSRGLLCISDSLKVTANRARALVQHEVGTHVGTHYNGTRQPPPAPRFGPRRVRGPYRKASPS